MKAVWEHIRGALKSKTVWFNIALYAVDVIGQFDFIKNDPDLAILIATLGNIALRFVTKTGLRSK